MNVDLADFSWPPYVYTRNLLLFALAHLCRNEPRFVLKKSPVLLALVYGIFSFSAAAAEPITLKWIVAHGPKDQGVIQSMEHLSRRVLERTHGQVKIEAINAYPKQNEIAVLSGGIGAKSLRKVLNGEADFSQVSTFLLASFDPVYELFDLPFLFDDYSHLERMITGAGGSAILERAAKSSGGKILALDFTFCGGYRILYGSKPVRTVGEFAGIRMEALPDFEFGDIDPTFKKHRSARSDFFHALGVKFVKGKSISELGTDLFEKDSIDLLEAAYKEIFWNSEILKKKISYLIEMKHSVVTTTVVANAERFKRLPPEVQQILREEIHAMAIMERRLFVQANLDAKAALVKGGAKVIEISGQERLKLQELSKPIFQRFQKTTKLDALELVKSSRQP